MSLYDRIASRPGGARALAASRLRYEVLAVLHQAFEASDLESQRELAERLGVRRSAVNQVLRGDGNVHINTLAEYLHEMGYELDVHLVPAGEPRRAALEGRPARRAAAISSWTTSASSMVSPIESALNDHLREVGMVTALGTPNLMDKLRSSEINFLGVVTPKLPAAPVGLTATSWRIHETLLTGDVTHGL